MHYHTHETTYKIPFQSEIYTEVHLQSRFFCSYRFVNSSFPIGHTLRALQAQREDGVRTRRLRIHGSCSH